ncbi:MAG TPA: methionyl-tRNA formyltransferase [Burkholderiales bacterium]
MRLAFAGTPVFAVRALAALHAAGHQVVLVFTQPDRAAGRGQRPAPSAVKEFALAHGLPLSQPETWKSPEPVALLREARADVFVVAAYGAILPGDALTAARLGAINIHASLLPRWRGAAPIQRALLAGDRETGISIMQMDVGLDTGPVLAQQRIDIGNEEDGGSLHDRLAELGARMIVPVVADAAAGKLSAQPQPALGITYARKIEKSETRLDWSKAATELDRAVRAFSPSPGAVARHGAETIKIWRAHATAGEGAPGTILEVTPSHVLVACGTGALSILSLQRGGGRRLPAGEFVRGHPIQAGERLE